MNDTNKKSEALLFNQILSLCKDDMYCKDISVNIISFIRRFFEYSKDYKPQFEAIEKCIKVKILITKLFETIMNRYDSFNDKWSNTQQLIFLWTIYECKQNGTIDDNDLYKLLKWAETMFSFNDLVIVFKTKSSIDSFADFTNELYKYNMLSTLLQDDEDHVDEDEDDGEEEYQDDEEDDDDDDVDIFDLMGIENTGTIIENINEIKDEDLFIVDEVDDDDISNKNKRLLDDEDEISSQPPSKKQKVDNGGQ